MAERGQPQPPPASDAPASPEQRAALIAAALGAGVAAGAAVSAPVTGAVGLAALTRLLTRWGYRREVVRWALRVTTRVLQASPAATPRVAGPAADGNAAAARVFTAWFIERSTQRVEKAYAEGAEPGQPEVGEARYVEQHLDAQARRRSAARRVDAEARRPGHVTDAGDPDGPPDPGPRVILRWRAHPDDRTTPECRAADGCWFYADRAPIIGYPGMPHGGTCRCWPAHAGSLAEVARGRHVNDAVRDMIGHTDRRHPAAAPRERTTA